jgi:aspartate aminotransferase
MQTLQSQSTSNPSTISHAATLAALEGGTDFLLELIDELRTCRDLVVDTMARCPGLRCDALDGAFYAFVDCSGAIGATTPSGDHRYRSRLRQLFAGGGACRRGAR